MKRTLEFGGLKCESGQKVQGMMTFADTGIYSPTTIINGKEDGKLVLLTTGIHGGEYPSIEGVMELARELQPEDITGAIIIIHPVNVDGFLDRVSGIYPKSGENLNRNYPGNPNGTIGERFAYALTNDLIKYCDFMIDTHGGDLHETLPPYVYYPGVGNQDVAELSRQASLMIKAKYMVCSQCDSNAYHMCNHFGIPSMLVEMGGRGLWTKEEVDNYKANIINVLKYLNVCEGDPVVPEPAHVITNAAYIDAGHSGCWYPMVKLEERVKKGQLLGVIKDFFGNVIEEVYAEFDSLILFYTVSLAIKAGDPIITYGI